MSQSWTCSHVNWKIVVFVNHWFVLRVEQGFLPVTLFAVGRKCQRWSSTYIEKNNSWYLDDDDGTMLKTVFKKKEVIDNHANSWLPYVDKKKAVQIDEKVLQIKVNQRTRKWTTKHRLLKYFYRNFMGVTIVVGFKVYCLVFVWSQCLVCWIGVRSLFKTSVVGWSMFGSSLDGFLFSICDEKVLHDRYSFIFYFFCFLFFYFFSAPRLRLFCTMSLYFTNLCLPALATSLYLCVSFYWKQTCLSRSVSTGAFP